MGEETEEKPRERPSKTRPRHAGRRAPGPAGGTGHGGPATACSERDRGRLARLPRKPPQLGGVFLPPRTERQPPCSCRCDASRLQLAGLRGCTPASRTGREGPGPRVGPSGGWGASARDPEPSGTRASAQPLCAPPAQPARPALLPGPTCRAEQTVTALRPSSTTAPTRPSPPPPRRTRFVQPVLPPTPQTQPGPGDRKATAKGVDAWTDDGSGPATLGPAQDGAAPGHTERRRRGSEGTVSPPSPHGGRACLLLKQSCLRSRTGRRPWLGCVPVSAHGGPCVGSLELLPQVLSLERQNTQNWLTQGGVVVRE